jgi:uncharacterized oxidoreductase
MNWFCLLNSHHPDLNILVNNAGIQYNYDFLNTTEITYKINQDKHKSDSPLATMCFTYSCVTTSAYSAAIINVSSGLAIAPKRSAPVYCGTKAAIHIFSQALRYQLETHLLRFLRSFHPW